MLIYYINTQVTILSSMFTKRLSQPELLRRFKPPPSYFMELKINISTPPLFELKSPCKKL